MEGGQRTNDFSFAPRPGYAVQIRLTPELKQALFHAQTTGQAVSLKLRQDGSNQQAILTIGGQEHFFSTATENNCDVIQLPDPTQPQSDCIAIGCVKQKLNQQRTLNDGIKSRVRASGMEAQLKQKQRQAVLLDKRIQGGVVTKTVTRQVTPPTSVKPPPAPALAQPVAARTAPAVTKRPLEPPKPKSKKPGGGAAVGRGPVGSTPPHPPQPTPATSLLNTPIGTPPHGAGAEPAAAAAAAAAATVVAAAAAVAAPQQQQQLQEVPKAAVMAAAKGEAQLCLVAIMMSQPSMSTTMLTKCMDRAYALARQKPEAKEYVKRVLQAACELVPPNRLRLRAEVLARDGPRVEALAAEQAAARTSARSPQASAQEQAGPGSAEKPAKKKREATPKLEASAATTEQTSLRGMQPAAAANHTADAAARNLPPKKKRIEAGGRKLLPNGEPVRKKGPSGMPSTASMGDDDFDDLGDVAEPVRRRSGPTGMRSTASIGGSLEELGGSVGGVPRGSSPSGSLRDGPGAAGGKGKKRSREAAVGHAAAAAPASQLARNWSSEEEWGPGAAGTSPAGTTTLEENGSDDEGPMVINRKHAKHRKQQRLAAAAASNPATSKDAPEAATGQNEEAGRGFAWYVMMQEQAERDAAAAAAAEEEQLQQQAAAKRQQQQQGPERVAQQVGSGSVGGGAGSAGSEDGPGIVGPPTTTTSQGPSPGSVNGLHSMVAPSRGAGAAVDAGLDPDDLAYAELEADADLPDADAELYRQLAAAAEAGPATVAPISSLEQHRQYEQEYRRKYDVYFKVHQRYNAILREAEGWQDAIATAADEQQRAKWQGELWRYGAKNFRLLRQWQRLAAMLQQALQGIRAEVTAYIALLKRRQQEQQEGEQVQERL